MKILAFSTIFPSSLAPAQGIFVYQRLAALAVHDEIRVVHPLATMPLAGRLRNRGRVVEHETRGPLSVYHRPFYYLPGLLKRFDPAFYAASLLPWLRGVCEEFRPDILDAEFCWPDGAAMNALSRELHLPYIMSLRGTINVRHRTAAFGKRLALALQGAEAVISVSRPMADIAVSLGARPSRVHVIPNGVNAELFCPLPRAQARQALALPVEGPLLVALMNVHRAKGIEELLQALAIMAKPPRLVVVGSCASPRYLGKLHAMLQALGLSSHVEFRGPCPHEQAPLYFNAADVSVLPSHSEGCPNVVLESISCGTPVVATPVGAVPDLVAAGVNGLLTPVWDPQALARTLAEAMERTWDRAAIRESVRQKSWESVARKVHQVVTEAAQLPRCFPL